VVEGGGVDPKIGENCLVSSPNLKKSDPPKFPNPEKAPAKIFRSKGEGLHTHPLPRSRRPWIIERSSIRKK